MYGTPRDLELAKQWLQRVVQTERKDSPFRRKAEGMLKQIQENFLAERAFLHLAERWHHGFALIEHDHAPPRTMDEHALAALLLVKEHGMSFTSVAWEQVNANIALAQKRPVPWIDRLPWTLAHAAQEMDPDLSPAIEELIGNLDHHNSSLRTWTMEVAWMVRPWLEYETAFPRLLGNVAGTLAGVEMAWGLAGEFFSSAEDFYDTAASWEPEGFVEQYEERVTRLKGRGLTSTQASFWKTESVCRHLITDAMLENPFG